MILNWIQKFAQYTLSFIFPTTPEIEKIEHMSPREFLDHVSPPLDRPPENICSLFKYKDPYIQKALWELKYKGNTRIATLFAKLLYDSIIEHLADEALFSNFTNPILIPVPLSRERQRERGWNQSEMICRELVKLNPDFTLDARTLIKIKHTLPQTHLDRAKRLKNLKNCFNVTDPDLIKNKNIILIDDVTTTGTTLTEARATLLKSGAHAVFTFTIAH